MPTQRLADLLIWYLVFVFSTTCHEAAHAFVAHRGGDPTAHAGGHASLDPLPHIRRSPMGMVLVPVITFLFNGWMVGWASVPVNPTWMQAHPRRAALMALAGPIANLSLALIAFFSLRLLLGAGVFTQQVGGVSISDFVVLPEGTDPKSLLGALARFLSVMLGLNVLLGLFNLIPFPPLDGATVAEGASPGVAGRLYAKLREVPMIELLGLLVAWNVFQQLALPALRWVLYQLYA
jgi:Zn-dependent protease